MLKLSFSLCRGSLGNSLDFITYFSLLIIKRQSSFPKLSTAPSVQAGGSPTWVGGAGPRTAGSSSFCPHLIREGLVSPLGGRHPFNLQAPAAPGWWVSAHNPDKSLLSSLERWWAWRAGLRLWLLLEGPVLPPPSKLWARWAHWRWCSMWSTYGFFSLQLDPKYQFWGKEKTPPVNLPQSTEPCLTPSSLPLPHAMRTRSTGRLRKSSPSHTLLPFVHTCWSGLSSAMMARLSWCRSRSIRSPGGRIPLSFFTLFSEALKCTYEWGKYPQKLTTLKPCHRSLCSSQT